MLSDLEIAQAAKLKPITDIAASLGLDSDDIELYGKYKAKINLDVIEKYEQRQGAKYIDVTAITPTPLGEGKTTTTIGLVEALNHIGQKAIATIRQPSMGPTFGIKGGAAGGGYAQVIPMEDFNLHLTGDVHAVSAAHNLLSAMLDNSIIKGNRLGIDSNTINWRRVIDISDRSLRHIVTGLGGKENGVPLESGFDISVSSEVMAILALTVGLKDLRKRLGRIVVAAAENGRPVTAEDLKAAGAMAVLLREAIKPNLLQTLENNPCIVHTGPFANIAHGNSSILADMIAMRLGRYVVTESGFGADIGTEKFMNIKCRYSNMRPNAVVLVATVRALKSHSGDFKIVAGQPLDRGLLEENIDALSRGCANLQKQVRNAALFGVPVVVAINSFPTDTQAEIDMVVEQALSAGAFDAVISNVWSDGGQGGLQLAEAVIRAAETPADFRFLYDLNIPIKEKIEIIATRVYGAEGVDYLPAAEKGIARYTEMGYDRLPVCMAKTHLSLSHDPLLKGCPSGFRLPIKEIRASVGAGFLYPLCGDIRTMPGLPTKPAAEGIDLDDEGRVIGLF
jgi:formyltetrahydrofolate synthetase